MDKPATPQKGPYKIKVEKNKIYFWCACGLSQKQPFCDGSHKGSGYTPNLVEIAEDKKIASLSQKSGAEVPFLRPKSLADDKTPIDAVLVHFIEKLLELGYDFDTFVCRDCTVPFIRNQDIVGSINLLKKKKANLVIGVYEQHLNPYYNVVEHTSTNHLKLVKKIKRPTSRQEAPKVYQMNGLHTYDVKKFLFPKRKIRTELNKALPYLLPIESGLMIDTEFEFKIAQLFIENKIWKL